MSSDYFSQFRNKEEIARDQAWEDHENFLCGGDCEFCRDETQGIHKYVDTELGTGRCPNCGSDETERVDNIDRCAVCGK